MMTAKDANFWKNDYHTTGVAMGVWGAIAPTFAKMVLEFSSKSMRKYVGGGGSSKSSEN